MRVPSYGWRILLRTFEEESVLWADIKYEAEPMSVIQGSRDTPRHFAPPLSRVDYLISFPCSFRENSVVNSILSSYYSGEPYLSIAIEAPG